jgi:hypothetical protein
MNSNRHKKIRKDYRSLIKYSPGDPPPCINCADEQITKCTDEYIKCEKFEEYSNVHHK